MNQFPNLLILVLTAGLALLQSTAEAQGNPVPGLLDLGEGVRLELVPLRAGAFLQGSPSTEKDRTEDETRRTVRITHDFSIGKHPVTRRQFERFVEETRYRTEAEKGTSGGFGWSGHELQQQRRFQWRDPGFQQTGEHPVTLVTWNDAQEFNRWLSRRTGLNVQLPTEAQWEYAARASTEHTYPGSDDPEAVAWHRGNAGNTTHPVGLKLPNAWGLLDMGGSVAEWCRDWYVPYPSDPIDDPETTRPPAGEKPRRVLRGGSWLRDPRNCRVAARGRSDPGSRNADIGFRIVVSLPPVVKATPPTVPDNPAADPETPPSHPPTEPRRTGIDSSGAALDEFPISSTTPAQGHIDRHHTVEEQPWFSMGSGVAFLGPLVVLLLAGTVVVRILSMLFRKNRDEPRNKRWNTAARIQRPTPPIPADGPGLIRIIDDGFWLPVNAAAVGATVEYEYLLDGRKFTDQVVFEPNSQGHFIYTGSRPSDICFTAAPPRNEEPVQNPTPIADPDSGIGSTTTPTVSVGGDIARIAAGVGGAAIGWHAVQGRTQRQDRPQRHRNPAAY